MNLSSHNLGENLPNKIRLIKFGLLKTAMYSL